MSYYLCGFRDIAEYDKAYRLDDFKSLYSTHINLLWENKTKGVRNTVRGVAVKLSL